MGGCVVFLFAELEEDEPVLPVSESISPVRRLPVNKVNILYVIVEKFRE